MMTCIVAIVAFREHHTFNGFKHMVVPVFGLLANLACMLFYLVGPFTVPGMSSKEPYIALGVGGALGRLRVGATSSRTSKAKGLPAFATESARSVV